MDEIKIVWAMPNYGPIYTPVYTSHMAAIASAASRMRVEHLGKMGAVDATDRMYTHSSENNVVQNFLDIKDATHLFLTESDMILPSDTLIRLLAHDKDLCSGVYFLRGGDGQPCLYKKTITPRDNPWVHSPVTIFPTQELFQADCPGVGCILIKRKVFETLKFPWFDLKEGMYGSDMYFYTNVRDAGFRVWCDPAVMCDQIDYQIVGYKDYVERMKKDPKFGSNGYIIPPASIANG